MYKATSCHHRAEGRPAARAASEKGRGGTAARPALSGPLASSRAAAGWRAALHAAELLLEDQNGQREVKKKNRMQMRQTVPSRIRQSWAGPETLHTEHSAARADHTGVELPIISLSQIRRLDVGRIRLSDVVSYGHSGVVAERLLVAGVAVDHIQIAHHDTPARQGGPSENGLFRRRGPDTAARHRAARPRRSVSVPLVERPVTSAYLSTVPERIDSLPRSTGRATPPSALGAGTSQAESRQERMDSHNAWLLRKEGERGNTWKILELLQAGVPTCSADEEGRTACHFAAMNNHSKVGCTVVVGVHGWMHALCTRA